MAVRKSVTDDIVNEIIRKIQNRELNPGDKLPNEVAMAEEFGVSRIALREALQVLSARGLIVTQHGRGSYINKYHPQMLSDALYNIALLNNDPSLEILQLRKIIESEAARLCALQAAPEELQAIVFFRDEWEKARLREHSPDADQSRYELDRQLHLAIANGSHNRIFAQFVTTIHASMNMHQVSFSSKEQNIESTALYHREIVSAILIHDAKRAADMMYAHLDQVEKDYIEKELQKSGSEHS